MRKHLALNTTIPCLSGSLLDEWDFGAEIVRMRGSVPCEDLG